MNTFLLSFTDADKLVLPFFHHVKSKNFHIIITNEKYRRFYLNSTEYLDIKDLSQIIKEKSIIIRWGNRSKLPRLDNIVYNIGTSIHAVSNKKNAREIMENNHIRTIETLINPDDLHLMNYPIILRPLHHERGNFFHICDNLIEARLQIKSIFGDNYDSFYASSYFPRTNEYRFYCAHGRLLYVQEKIGVGTIDIRTTSIKNVNKVPWTTLPWAQITSGQHGIFLDIAIECLKANEIFKLDFSATDVLYDSIHQDFRICEINTMPELLDYGFQRYGKYFDFLINHSIETGDRAKRALITTEAKILWENDFS